ncbi:MAG: NAD(P)/FAD-dependent oxidoreductase [Oscillospiraceae bacterium]|nr:NAD(P)/FAD-dependent oxidoreductase [Oscillospiraceae bacterium]
MKTLRADVVVIGGGAAGLLAASLLSERGFDTLLLEPNRLTGKKLRITGKGRCNLTNNCDTRQFMENVPRNGSFLFSAVSRFGAADTMAFFERIGVPLKTERGSRVFPVSDSAHDVANALERFGRENGVRLLHKRAGAINVRDGLVTGVEAEDTLIICKAVILCTGGASYPGTGSTGDGYALAKSLGHTIIPPRPSLVPLVSYDDYCAEMQGFSLRNVTLRVFDENGALYFEELGEMLFTHFGVTGPLVLSASSHMRDYENHKYRLSIDLKPGLDERQLDDRILRDFKKYANRDFANSLSDLAGHTMIPVLVRLSGIPGETKVNSVTKEQRRTLVRLFKEFPVSVAGPRPVDEAIITTGGVNIKEINPKTMESKLVKGLYFAGEIIDVDAYTGGFNLQIAWSTAYAVAKSVELGQA